MSNGEELGSSDRSARDLLNDRDAEIDRLRAAATDALAGWRYIREHHGDLYGVGWDRVEKALADALARAA